MRLYETGKSRRGETFSQKQEVDDVIRKGVSLSRIWLIRMLLFMLLRERLSEKKVHATIPKGNMGYDQYTVPDTVTVEPTFVAFL